MPDRSPVQVEQSGFRKGDTVVLNLTDEWCAMLDDYRDLGDNADLLLRCQALRTAGIRSVEGTVVRVNIELDEGGYGHYEIKCPQLGDEPIDVAHDDLEVGS